METSINKLFFDFDDLILQLNGIFYLKPNDKFTDWANLTDSINTLLTSQVSEKKPLRSFTSRIKSNSHKNERYQAIFMIIEKARDPSFLKQDSIERNRMTQASAELLLLVEFKDFIICYKTRGISGSSDLLRRFGGPVSQDSLINSFKNNKNNFVELNVGSVDPLNKYNIKKTNVLAESLEESYHAYGRSREIIKQVTIKDITNSDRININVLNSSIKKTSSSTVSFSDYISFCCQIKNQLYKKGVPIPYIDAFSRPEFYKDHVQSIHPIGISFLLDVISHNKNIISVEYRAKEKTEKKEWAYLEKKLTQPFILEKRKNNNYEIKTESGNSLMLFGEYTKLALSKRKDRISINSPILKNIFIRSEDRDERLLDMINKGGYIISTSNVNEVIFNNIIYKDAQVYDILPYLKGIIIPDQQINSIKSEKGATYLNEKSSSFSEKSLFGVIEAKFRNHSEINYLYCDDLGDEWADFIALGSHSIRLIHAKAAHGDLVISKFHEVMGQVLKNINRFFDISRLSTKKNDYYKINHIKTDIRRLIKGSATNDFIEHYKNLCNETRTEKEAIIYLNFFSYEKISLNFLKIKEKKESIDRNFSQLLWILITLHNECIVRGVKLKIIVPEKKQD